MEKRLKNRGKEEKSGRKRKNREGYFFLPLLTDRAGYTTDLQHINLSSPVHWPKHVTDSEFDSLLLNNNNNKNSSVVFPQKQNDILKMPFTYKLFITFLCTGTSLALYQLPKWRNRNEILYFLNVIKHPGCNYQTVRIKNSKQWIP